MNCFEHFSKTGWRIHPKFAHQRLFACPQPNVPSALFARERAMVTEPQSYYQETHHHHTHHRRPTHAYGSQAATTNHTQPHPNPPAGKHANGSVVHNASSLRGNRNCFVKQSTISSRSDDCLVQIDSSDSVTNFAPPALAHNHVSSSRTSSFNKTATRSILKNCPHSSGSPMSNCVTATNHVKPKSGILKKTKHSNTNQGYSGGNATISANSPCLFSQTNDCQGQAQTSTPLLPGSTDSSSCQVPSASTMNKVSANDPPSKYHDDQTSSLANNGADIPVAVDVHEGTVEAGHSEGILPASTPPPPVDNKKMSAKAAFQLKLQSFNHHHSQKQILPKSNLSVSSLCLVWVFF